MERKRGEKTEKERTWAEPKSKAGLVFFLTYFLFPFSLCFPSSFTWMWQRAQQQKGTASGVSWFPPHIESSALWVTIGKEATLGIIVLQLTDSVFLPCCQS